MAPAETQYYEEIAYESLTCDYKFFLNFIISYFVLSEKKTKQFYYARRFAASTSETTHHYDTD